MQGDALLSSGGSEVLAAGCLPSDAKANVLLLSPPGTLLYPQGMLELAKIYYFIFGALTIVGGVIGYKKAGSKASLIAGGIPGVLILVAAVLIMNGQAQNGAILGLVVSSLLEIRFFPAFVKTKKVMPAGMMTGLSMIGTLLSVLALVFNR